LLNSPTETNRYVIAVHRDPASRGGSHYLHDALRIGDVLSIGGPGFTVAMS
jgi:vanillate O-demethylase ferredoxin subunit